MAELNSAEKVKMNLPENISTDVMTGGVDERMYLYSRSSGTQFRYDGVSSDADRLHLVLVRHDQEPCQCPVVFVGGGFSRGKAAAQDCQKGR